MYQNLNTTIEIQEELTSLYQELNTAEYDLHCFESISLDSGEANWVKDQKKLIQEIKDRIEVLQTKL